MEAMKNPTALIEILRRIWPGDWRIADSAGRPRECYTRKGSFIVVVEWRVRRSLVTLKRFYGEQQTVEVSVTGSADGWTAEGIRRAYQQARMRWTNVQMPPVGPSMDATHQEITDDKEFWSGVGALIRQFDETGDDNDLDQDQDGDQLSENGEQ
jgi:hypothetical protein